MKKKTKKTETEQPAAPDTPTEPTPRAKQIEIPGTERPRIREIDEAAEAYVEVRNTRQELTKQEVTRKKILSDLMHKHADAIGRDAEGGITYGYDDMRVILKPAGEELKVKHVDPDDPEPEPIVVGTAPADNSEGGE